MSECRVMVARNRGWEKYENFQAEEDEETGRKYPDVDEQVFEESGSLFCQLHRSFSQLLVRSVSGLATARSRGGDLAPHRRQQ